jgi:hypothetical protein
MDGGRDLMAVTWRGSTVTPPIAGGADDGEFVFALVNTFRSRRRINVLRMIAVGDSVEISATAGHIMPLLKTWRCAATSVAGGIPIVKRPAWDTAINEPDPAIRLLYSGWATSEANRISVASVQGPAWQQFIQRGATTVEQRRTLDNSMLSRLTSVEDFSVAPGQALVMSWHYAAAPTGGVVFVNLAWEEDQIDAGFTLGGTVTLDGSPVTGAKVHVLTDADRDMPAPELQQLVTDGSGNWSTTLATGVKAAAFVQHRVGGTLYTDEGKPYLEEP